jgi:putative ABC transport system substrate-binding protein
VVLSERERIADLAARHRLPAVYGFRSYTEAGGLMAYAASRAELQRQSAVYVHKILNGAKPADLPVEQPTKFEMIINLKAAKALGLV